MKSKKSIICGLFIAGFIINSVSYAGVVVYEFTGGSLTPTLSGLPSGVSASNFSIGDFDTATLQSDALRLTDGDLNGNSSTVDSFTNNTVLSFSLTIPSDVTLSLTSLSFDYISSGIDTDFIFARTFSSIDGTDAVVDDTIGLFGKGSSDPASATDVAINLVDPTLNTLRGSNVTASDFTDLSNQTITFSMPMISDGANAAADYLQFDNITLNFTAVPESSAALLVSLGLLALLRRRR